MKPSVYRQRPGSAIRPDGLVLHLREPHRPRAQHSPSSLFSHPLHFLFFPSILSFIQTQSLPPLFLSSLAASHFEHHSFLLFSPPSTFTFPPCPLPHPFCSASLLFLLPSLPSFISRLSSSFILCSTVSKRQKGYEEKPDHCGRGVLAQPLLLTLGPCAQFICLRRH